MRQSIRRTVLDGAARLLRRWLANPDCRAICRQYGFHPTPLNYMYPIPDVEDFPVPGAPTTYDATSLQLNDAEQLDRLRTLHACFGAECQFPARFTGNPHEFHLGQTKFTRADAAVLHMLIRQTRPRRLIEVGSGNSTLVAARAGLLNAGEGSPLELCAIEPFPQDYLHTGLPGLTRLIAEPVQRVPVSLFQTLQAEDILFIDSSHVVKRGSDLLHLVLKVLPALRSGVVLHFHDIYLPYEYPLSWFANDFYYNESYFIQAFLSFNRSFEILLANHYLDRNYPAIMRELFEIPNGPSSLWLRKRE
jgi:hypothetical protein